MSSLFFFKIRQYNNILLEWEFLSVCLTAILVTWLANDDQYHQILIPIPSNQYFIRLMLSFLRNNNYLSSLTITSAVIDTIAMAIINQATSWSMFNLCTVKLWRCRDLENTNLVHQCLLRGGGGGEGDGAELDDPKLSSHRVDYWGHSSPRHSKKKSSTMRFGYCSGQITAGHDYANAYNLQLQASAHVLEALRRCLHARTHEWQSLCPYKVERNPDSNCHNAMAPNQKERSCQKSSINTINLLLDLWHVCWQNRQK